MTKIFIDYIEWRDGKSTLEEQLPRIIAKLEVKGENCKKERIEREAHWAKRKEIERIKALEEQRKDDELLKFQQILQEARRHNEAEFLRKYLNGVEESSIKSNSLSDELRNWLLWGRKKADWYDPLVAISDELMEDVDKDTLTRNEQKEKNHWINFNN